MTVGDPRFDQAVSGLRQSIASLLLEIPTDFKSKCYEVRLRVGQPLSITTKTDTYFVECSGKLTAQPTPQCYRVDKRDLEESVLCLCAHSIHSHQQEFIEGFISVKGGHRAGICGAAVLHNDKLQAVRDISSINLRVARQVRGAATELVKRAFSHKTPSILLAGPPSSGKTTVLRDLARQLSTGVTGKSLKISVIDERYELGAVFEGIPQNDLGPNTDLLSGYPKGTGIQLAVRTLSPDMILCDEIGGKAETLALLEGLNAGVKITATAHASSLDELTRREQVRILLQNGVFETVVLLESGGKIRQIVKAGDLYGQADRDVPHRIVQLDGGPGIHSVHGKAGYLDPVSH